jgi:PAS domain S-box-containing protein
MESTTNFKTIFEATKGMRFVFIPDSPKFTIAAASNDMCRHVGLTREQLLGLSVFDAFPTNPADPNSTAHDNLKHSLEYVVKHKKEHQMERQRYDLPTPDGGFKEIYWTNNSTPVLDEHGEVTCIVHTTEDITDSVIQEREHKRSKEIEHAYRLLMQAPWIIGIAMGDDYVLEMANDAALKLWNKSHDIIGRSMKETIPELKGQGIFELFDQVRTTRTTFRAKEQPVATYINGQQQMRYFDIVYQPFYEKEKDEPTGVFTMSYDVTDLVVSRQKLEESERRLQKTISIETVGVIYFDLEGSILDCNPAFEKMSGYSTADMKSGKVRWDKITPPEFMEVTLRSQHEFITRGQNTPYEKQYIRPDGSRWWGLFAGKRLSEKECVEFVLDISLMKVVEEELEARVQARTNDLQRLTEELLRSNQSLEQFAYAASHDMKEPLRKALLFSDRLHQSFKDETTDEQKALFAKLENAVKRMQTLIEDLLSYSHLSLEQKGFEQLDLHEIVNSVISDLDLEIEERRAVIKIGPLCTVHGHYRQLHQMFHNLIMNALKYSRECVIPEIVISCEQVQTERFGRDVFHMVKVSDNGIGFEQEHAEKIFDVFTRLHGLGAYKGTGIGLSIVRKVMESHKGFVEAEGTPGSGAVFKLYFPVVA